MVEKIDLMLALDALDTPTAQEVAEYFGIAYHVAAVALLRLVRSSLAERWHSLPEDPYRYQLTERGEQRLVFLEQEEDEEDGGVDEPEDDLGDEDDEDEDDELDDEDVVDDDESDRDLGTPRSTSAPWLRR